MTRTQRWAIASAATIGMALGLALFTFGYARGYSYLTNDPAACANCHVMNEHFAAWSKGSHHAVATCNDCHTPHNIAGKYATKAKNGFWHSYYFTFGGYPDPLRITAGDRAITEGTCRSCHQEITAAIDHGDAPDRRAPRGPSPAPAMHSSLAGEPISCIRCHQYVGHLVR